MVANPLTGTGLSVEIASTGTLPVALGGSITREQMKVGVQGRRKIQRIGNLAAYFRRKPL